MDIHCHVPVFNMSICINVWAKCVCVFDPLKGFKVHLKCSDERMMPAIITVFKPLDRQMCTG